MLSDDSRHDYSHVYVVDPIGFFLLHAENPACDKKKTQNSSYTDLLMLNPRRVKLQIGKTYCRKPIVNTWTKAV